MIIELKKYVKKAKEKLAKHLNENNENNIRDWKLKNDEIYFVYEIDNYDSQPMYKLKNTKNKISITYNI